jgi:hypothetical protein
MAKEAQCGTGWSCTKNVACTRKSAKLRKQKRKRPPASRACPASLAESALHTPLPRTVCGGPALLSHARSTHHPALLLSHPASTKLWYLPRRGTRLSAR